MLGGAPTSIVHETWRRPILQPAPTARTMLINDVDLSLVSDGTYVGDFSYDEFTYEVDMTVKDHRTHGIRILRNRKSAHAKKAEGVVQRVMQA